MNNLIEIATSKFATVHNPVELGLVSAEFKSELIEGILEDLNLNSTEMSEESTINANLSSIPSS